MILRKMHHATHIAPLSSFKLTVFKRCKWTQGLTHQAQQSAEFYERFFLFRLSFHLNKKNHKIVVFTKIAHVFKTVKQFS